MFTPPSPWIGSSITAQVLLVAAFLMAWGLLNSTWTKPGVRGGKASWYLGWPVAATMARVRPWKELRAVMTSWAPPSFSLPYFRASFTIPSLASAPLLQKKALAKQLLFTRSSASLVWGME